MFGQLHVEGDLSGGVGSIGHAAGEHIVGEAGGDLAVHVEAVDLQIAATLLKSQINK